MSNFSSILVMVSIPVVLTGCIRLKTEPIVVEPIYIEITVNHKIQKELDNYFDAIDRSSKALEYKELPSKEDK